MKKMIGLIAGVLLLNGGVALAQADAPAAAKAIPAKGCCGTCKMQVKTVEVSTNACDVLCAKLNLTEEQLEKTEVVGKACKKARDVKEATEICLKEMETILTADQLAILKDAIEKNDGICPMASACMEDKACGKMKCGAGRTDPIVTTDPDAPENK